MISVVIPFYNEEENIVPLHDRLTKILQQTGSDFEIICIDDGSIDGSFEILTELADRDEHVCIIRLSRNFGHQAAISAGLKHASGEEIVIMDGDLQDPPEVVPEFLDKLKSGYDVAYAVRTKRKEVLWKRMAYSIFYKLLRLISDIEIPIDSGDFCAMNRKVLEVLNLQLPENIKFIRGLRAFAGFKQIGVEYERDRRYAGVEKYTMKKLIKLALNGIFDFSTFPLRLATYAGFIIASLSIIIGTFFIFHRIFDFKIFGYSPVDNPGLATVVVGIYFLAGLILIMLGIVGAYIGRIYYEVKRRPDYIVNEIYTKRKT